MMNQEEFENLVKEALDHLPKRFQEKLENVAVVVENWPTPGQIASLNLAPGSLLFGLYHGVPKISRGASYSALPDKITIFAGPILRVSATPEIAREKVAQVVKHEIAHHFGLNEVEIKRAERS